MAIDPSTSSIPLTLNFDSKGKNKGVRLNQNIVVSSIDASAFYLSGSPFTGSVTVSPTAPESPNEGDIWLEKDCTESEGSPEPDAPAVLGTSITANYNLSNNEVIIYADATTASFVISGVDASAYPGRILDIHKIDSTSNIISVSGLGSTISGDSVLGISTQFESFTLHSFNDNWYIL